MDGYEDMCGAISRIINPTGFNEPSKEARARSLLWLASKIDLPEHLSKWPSETESIYNLEV